MLQVLSLNVVYGLAYHVAHARVINPSPPGSLFACGKFCVPTRGLWDDFALRPAQQEISQLGLFVPIRWPKNLPRQLIHIVHMALLHVSNMGPGVTWP